MGNLQNSRSREQPLQDDMDRLQEGVIMPTNFITSYFYMQQ